MAVILEGITLPTDLEWVDEFSGWGVGQTISPTLTGSLVVEENTQADGRPISLQSGDGSWVQRSVVEDLQALAETALAEGSTLALTWADARTFTVVFDRTSGKGFSARQVYRQAASTEENSHPYFIKIDLIIQEATQ